MRHDKREYWAKMIAEQEAAGQTVKAFCEEHGVSPYSFYVWRRRLRQEPGKVGFALIETKPSAVGEAPLELVFVNGERLRIGMGVDPKTLRTALAVIRA